MRGYPLGHKIAVDYENLVKMPEYRDRALAELQAIAAIKDDTIMVATAEQEVGKPEALFEVKNPSQIFMRVGFEKRADFEDFLERLSTVDPTLKGSFEART